MVVATDLEHETPASGPEIATTLLFTDDPLLPQQTRVRALHMTELRTAVNAVRIAAGLAPATFTNPVIPGFSPISAIDISELRAALDPARAAIGMPAMTYSTPAAAGDMIYASDIRELRTGTK